ncbi:MAG: metallophosphoesterase [Lachnospiraceae bacterium]|nr:metallophosphoesterase [Lachnospiraceae bacterium]
MRVLVCSDTHRRHDNYLKVVEKEGPFDFLIHCGDTEGGEYLIHEAAGCPCEIVMGNNDFFSDLPRERIFHLGGRTVWVTHGHNYYVSLDTAMLKEEARAKGANVVMFGHTHRPLMEDGSVMCVNPGSLSYPRQANHKPSYIVLEIDENDHWNMEIKYL